MNLYACCISQTDLSQGVLRMMGTTRVRVIQLLLCQAFSYSIPSWALGLASSQASAVGVFAGFESLTVCYVFMI